MGGLFRVQLGWQRSDYPYSHLITPIWSTTDYTNLINNWSHQFDQFDQQLITPIWPIWSTIDHNTFLVVTLTWSHQFDHTNLINNWSHQFDQQLITPIWSKIDHTNLINNWSQNILLVTFIWSSSYIAPFRLDPLNLAGNRNLMQAWFLFILNFTFLIDSLST